MSAWRRHAIALFPEMRRFCQDPDTTYYWVFFRLLPEARAAHTTDDIDKLRRIYQFAEWCFKQRHRAPDVWNAAATAFYEHLVDRDVTLAAIPEWVPPAVFEAMRDEFQKRLRRKGTGEFEALLQRYWERRRSITEEPPDSYY